MSEHTELAPTGRGKIKERSNEALAQAGRAADRAAAAHVFTDYRSRKAANTLRTQDTALALFANYIMEAGVRGTAVEELQSRPESWRGVSWGLVEGFVKWLLRAGYSVATVNNRLSTIKVYAKLALKAGAIEPGAYQLIKAVTGYSGKEAKRINERRETTRVGDKKEEHVSLAPDEARRLKQYEDTPQGRRDRLLMCLLLDHGLRVGEVARLQVADFNLKSGELVFYRPKVDKVQRHSLTADALAAAFDYFTRDAPAMGRILLASRKGGELVPRPMSKRAITKRVRYLGRSLLGVRRLSAHDCRHYWATDAAHNGTDPFRLQEAGGWNSLAMPRRYVEEAKVANEGVRLSQD